MATKSHSSLQSVEANLDLNSNILKSSGTAAIDFVAISEEEIYLEKHVALVSSDEAGAISTFSGTTRGTFNGKVVERLEYEGYIPMAEKELRAICRKIRTRWDVIHIAMSHRLGVVAVGKPSVIIAVSSEHRRDSLQAVQFAIDEIKATVPIWKLEVYAGDSRVWKENKEWEMRGSAEATAADPNGGMVPDSNARRNCCGNKIAIGEVISTGE